MNGSTTTITFALVCLLALTTASNPGIKIAGSSTGLTYMKDVLQPLLVAKLSTMTFPPMSFSKDSIDCKIQNATISGLSLDSAFVLNPVKGLVTAVTHLDVSLNADWSYQESVWPHVPYGDGTVTANVSQSSASIDMLITSDNGKPHVKAAQCSITVDVSYLHFDGGLSGDLLNLFSSTLKEQITSEIQSQVCAKGQAWVNTDLNAILSTFQAVIDLKPYAAVHMTLTGNPTVSVDYAGLSLQGEVTPLSSSAPAPPQECAPMPSYNPATLDTSMLQLFFNEYVFNTGAWTLFSQGVLTKLITPAMVPPQVPFKLNTDILSQIAPEVYKLYPKHNMTLTVAAAASPALNISRASLNASAPITLAFDVLVPATTGTAAKSVPVFTLGCPVKLGGDAFVVTTPGAEAIGAKFSLVSCQLELLANTTGPVVVADLQGLVSFAVTDIAMPMINKELAKGIPLPRVEGIALQNTLLSFGEGYFEVTSDVTYTPPPPNATAAAVASTTIASKPLPTVAAAATPLLRRRRL